MISQSQFGNATGYGYNYNYAPREAGYPASSDAGIAPDQTSFAPASTGVDSFNSSPSNLAPATAPAPEQKKGLNPWTVGATVVGGAALIGLGIKGHSDWGWFGGTLKNAGEELSKQTKNLADEVAEQFSHLRKGDLNNFSKDELEQLKNAKNKTEADKLIARFKKAGEESKAVDPPKAKPSVNTPSALKNIDIEKSDVKDIRKALKQHEIDLRDEATELADELEGTFDSNKRAINRVNPRFDLSDANKTISHADAANLPAKHEIDEASLNLVDDLTERMASGVDDVEKAQAMYQLENGSYKLTGFNDKYEPIYAFEPKPLFSEQEKHVINLHNAGREKDARKLATDLGFTHNPATSTGPAMFKNGGKEITLPSGKPNDYVAEVTSGRALAFDEHGNPMDETALQEYLDLCKKEKEAPDLNIDGHYVDTGSDFVPAKITVNTGSAGGSVKRNPVA